MLQSLALPGSASWDPSGEGLAVHKRWLLMLPPPGRSQASLCCPEQSPSPHLVGPIWWQTAVTRLGKVGSPENPARVEPLDLAVCPLSPFLRSFSRAPFSVAGSKGVAQRPLGSACSPRSSRQPGELGVSQLTPRIFHHANFSSWATSRQPWNLALLL